MQSEVRTAALILIGLSLLVICGLAGIVLKFAGVI